MTALLLFGAVALARAEVMSFPMADEFGFAETKRLDGLPLLQRKANAPRTTTIQLKLHEMVSDVDARIAAFRAHASLKQAALLVYVPTGAPVGWFVTPKLEVTPILIGRPGELRAADVSWSIREAPADRVQAATVSDGLAARRSTRLVRSAT